MRTIWTGHRHDSRSAQKLGSWSSSKWTAGRFVRRENATQADQTKWPTEIYRNEYRLTAQVFLHLLFATTLNRTAKRTKSTGLHQFINWFVKQKGKHLVGLTLSKLNICWSSSFFFWKETDYLYILWLFRRQQFIVTSNKSAPPSASVYQQKVSRASSSALNCH